MSSHQATMSHEDATLLYADAKNIVESLPNRRAVFEEVTRKVNQFTEQAHIQLDNMAQSILAEFEKYTKDDDSDWPSKHVLNLLDRLHQSEKKLAQINGEDDYDDTPQNEVVETSSMKEKDTKILGTEIVV
jgi:hypothetical protein